VVSVEGVGWTRIVDGASVGEGDARGVALVVGDSMGVIDGRASCGEEKLAAVACAGAGLAFNFRMSAPMASTVARKPSSIRMRMRVAMRIISSHARAAGRIEWANCSSVSKVGSENVSAAQA
jgi:hypothetical protein